MTHGGRVVTGIGDAGFIVVLVVLVGPVVQTVASIQGGLVEMID